MTTTETEIGLSEVLAAISTMTESQLMAVRDAANGRQSILRQIAASVALDTLEVGAEVVLQDLSPKYLNGARGTVSGKRDGKIVVALSEPIRFDIRNRFGSTVTAPASCVKAAG